MRAWERVGVPAGERPADNCKSTPEFQHFTPVFNSIFLGSDSKHWELKSSYEKFYHRSKDLSNRDGLSCAL